MCNGHRRPKNLTRRWPALGPYGTIPRKPICILPTDRPERFEYINQLRVIAAFGVVVGHVSIWVVSMMEPLSFDWWVGSFGHFMARWTVPVFVMVSGALLLDPSKEDRPIDFYKKRMRRILVPLIFWTA